MNISLRAPSLNDYLVLSTWITDKYKCSRWAGPGLQFPFKPEALPRLLAVEDSESYCLTDGGHEPLGFGQVWFGEPNAAHLMRIIVSPEFRGRGLGRRLCSCLIERAMENGNVKHVTLRVYRDNSIAVALYEGMGFSTIASKSSKEAFFMINTPTPIKEE